CSSPRWKWPTVRIPPPPPWSAATCPPGRSRSAAGRSASSRAGPSPAAPEPRPPRPRKPQNPRKPSPRDRLRPSRPPRLPSPPTIPPAPSRAANRIVPTPTPEPATVLHPPPPPHPPTHPPHEPRPPPPPRQNPPTRPDPRRSPPKMTGITSHGEKHLVLVSGRAHPVLAQAVAEELGIEIVPSTLYDFANGEIYVRFAESVRGADAFVLQSHTAPI